jgi:hypothetical protein
LADFIRVSVRRELQPEVQAMGQTIAETLTSKPTMPGGTLSTMHHTPRSYPLNRLAILLVGILTVGSVRADLPSVRFDRLTPLGGAAGSTVEVEVAGADLEGVESLLLDHPGLKATFVKERRFRLSIAADVPPGTYDVRLVGRFGVSNPRLFTVSHGLAEVMKKDPADATTPQVIAVNSVVNGVCGGNREDVFRFAARKGQRIVAECQAGKLDSQMDATLSLTTTTDKTLVSNSGYHGRDPLVDFVAPEDGDYLVKLHDLSYRGGFPYRLIVSDRPQVATVFPRAVQAGQSTELSVFGRNLGPGSKPSLWSEFDLPLDETRLTVTPPAEVLDLGAYRFFEHPTDHGPLPTAATCTLRGFQVQPKLGDAPANAHPLLVVDTPVTLEAEPNDTPDKAQVIALPAVVSGRFDRERDADWYEIETTEAGPYSIEVYCERLGGRADPYLVVMDLKGNKVAEQDDFGHRINAFDGHLRDPSGQVNLAAKTKYRVLVQDRYRRGGARCQYVLTISRAVPDFYAAVIHSQNPGPAGTTVRTGGAAYLDVVLNLSGGFNGPVVVTAEGLPPGLHALPTTIRGTHGTFVLWADADAAEWTGTVRLFATAKQGERTLRREVRPYTRVWTDPSLSSSRPTRELAVAIRQSAPFALSFAEERMEAEAGKKAVVKLRLQRLEKEFKDKVTVLSVSPSGSLRVAGTEIPAGKDEVAVTVDVPAGAAPGEYTLTVLGQAQVPFSKDSKAAQKPNTLVSLPARPLTLVVTPKK